MEISNSLKDVYNKWDKKAPDMTTIENIKNIRHNPNTKFTMADKSLPQTRQWLNRGQKVVKPPILLTEEESHIQTISSFKSLPVNVPAACYSRPHVGNCCAKCLPLSGVAYNDAFSQNLGIKDILRLPTQNGTNGFLTRTFCYILYILQRRHNFKYTDVSGSVLTHKRVKEAISMSVQEQILGKENIPDDEFETLKAKQEKRAQAILNNMKSTISGFLLRMTSWMIARFFPKIISGIHVHCGQLEALKKTSESRVPVIYLPLHRSHLDYILLSHILYINDMRAPLVAAGNNLMIPIFGNLLRGLGAFFIKRKLDNRSGNKDHIYRAILHTYMSEFLNQGHHLEFFIEGGRSRTGKSCMPKAGLLSVIVDTLKQGNVEDVHIVPVAINYEKLVDGNFIAEQLGQRKVAESFTQAARSIWKMLCSKFGSIRVDFCQPFSLRELVESSNKFHLPQKLSSYPSSPHSPPSAIRSSDSNTCLYEEDDFRKTIKDISEHIVYDATNATSLMSTNLLSFLLLTKYRKGVPLHQLALSMTWLRKEIQSRKRDVGFTGESTDVIKHASALLGKEVVAIEKLQMEWSVNDSENNNIKMVFLKPSVQIPRVFELQYYANPVVSVFLLDSVLSLSFCSLLNVDFENTREANAVISVERQEFIKKAMDLCDILQYEFIFAPPCADLQNVLNEKVESLMQRSFFSFENKGGFSRNRHNYDEYEEEEDYNSNFIQYVKLNTEEEVVQELNFYKSILASLVESYWLVACCLPLLLQKEKSEKVFFQNVQNFAAERLDKGGLNYEESMGADAIKNAIRLFEHWKIIRTYMEEDNIKILYLDEACNEEQLEKVVERVEQFRV